MAIQDRIGEVDRLVAEIAAAAQEQASGLEAVNIAMGRMDKMTQQNAAMVQETSAASDALKAQAARVAAERTKARLFQELAGRYGFALELTWGWQDETTELVAQR